MRIRLRTAAALFAAALLAGSRLGLAETLATCNACHAKSKLPPAVFPADNPPNAARVALGRRLFYELDLSSNRSISCGSCHKQAQAFADARPHSVGITGEETRRNAPSLANVRWRTAFTWADPKISSLEQQMRNPLFATHPREMGLTPENTAATMARLNARPGYRRMFAKAFAGDAHPITIENAIKAIASFERTIISADAPYDRYRRGKHAYSLSEENGKALFFGDRAGCSRCHSGFDFNQTPQSLYGKAPPIDENYHAVGLPANPADRGVFEATGKPEDDGRFKTPSLRNVAITAPYMHDGSIPTLEGVLDMYAAGAHNHNVPRSTLIGDELLTDQERHDLIAFLHTLTDRQLLRNPRFARPKGASPTKLQR